MFQVVDVEEIENDGKFAVFVLQLWSESIGEVFPVMAWYSLAEHRMVLTTPRMDDEQKFGIMNDGELLDDMREAVMAERDAIVDAKEAEDRREERAKAKADQEVLKARFRLN